MSNYSSETVVSLLLLQAPPVSITLKLHSPAVEAADIPALDCVLKVLHHGDQRVIDCKEMLRKLGLMDHHNEKIHMGVLIDGSCFQRCSF